VILPVGWGILGDYGGCLLAPNGGMVLWKTDGAIGMEILGVTWVQFWYLFLNGVW